jgi:hypothetical protein
MTGKTTTSTTINTSHGLASDLEQEEEAVDHLYPYDRILEILNLQRLLFIFE